MLGEGAVQLHGRVELPGDQQRVLEEVREVRQADEIPFGIGADVD
jgi:hypothetical protein